MGFEVAYDPGENIKIAKAIQKHPVIYNIKKYPPIEYRGLTDKAWAKVAAELGVSEGYCKGRWTNIKGCFKRYLKNKAQSSNTKTYYLAEYLNFMLPFMKVGNYRPNTIKRVIHTEEDIHTNEEEEDKNEIIDVTNDFEVKLVDSDGEEESFFISNTSDHAEELVVSMEEERNADWDFLSSLLPDMHKMDAVQKTKFKNGLLTAIDMVLYGEDL